jgi:hypothetical protein
MATPTGTPPARKRTAARSAMPLVAAAPAATGAAWLAECRERWRSGDWAGLSHIDEAALEAAAPEARAELATLVAGAHLQRGELEAARRVGGLARAWGASRRALALTWLQAPERALALAAWAAGDAAGAESHLRRSLPDTAVPSPFASTDAKGGATDDAVAPGSVALAHALAALRDEAAQRLAPPLAASTTAVRWVAPRWIDARVDQCFAEDDVHDAADRLLETVLREPDDRVAFHLVMSDRFKAQKDNATALHFLGAAQNDAAHAQPRLVAELARRFGALGRADAALDVAVGQWLDERRPLPLDAALAKQLLAQHQRVREQTQAQAQHGHHVLLGHLQAHAPEFAARAKARPRGLTVIEIGTTREQIPGQGSTRQIAAFCLQHGLKFVTVDMDPHNSRMARDMFASMQAPFEAVTLKGEDFLREWKGPIDIVFLDAYDFDHGKHSALRQSRYEKYLGSPIDDAQCHQMHLDCAHSLVAKLAPDGIVCFDDTWLEDGRWVAKGVLAMPWLMAQGFRLLEARNHAALLGWADPAARAKASP